jgi:hypothetical protein
MSERNGHVQWGAWSFDYNVADSEGLALLAGSFRGRRVFSKLSLPVIRVKYTQDEDFLHNPLLKNGCGPYNDQITWDPEDFGENLNPIAGPHHLVKIGGECGGRYVCVKSFIGENGTPWLELGVYARIGAYHIYQAWNLNDHGVVAARAFSKGLSCNLDHWHHPYWRFNIDLDEPGQQRVNIYDGGTHVGVVDREGRFLNATWADARYNIENVRTGAKAWIFPPKPDADHGIVGPNDFSRVDAYVRKYRPGEDRAWPHRPEEDIGFAVHEPLAADDVVFWSVGHLHHRADEGKDHWHSVGPTIVFDIPEPVVTEHPPDSFRRVRVEGTIKLKDYRLIGSDKKKTQDFEKTVLVNPNTPHAELTVNAGPVGDVKLILRLRVVRNADNSVFVNFDARLFDEKEVVSTVGTQFNVLEGASLHWGGVHLVDHHGGDPDTGDVAFTVTNDRA